MVLVTLACGTQTEEWRMRGWTATPSATVSSSDEAKPTQTPFVVVVTSTPQNPTPSPEALFLCVVADKAVYLRPSPEATLYPLDPIPSGTQVLDTGTRKGNWVFVQIGDSKGWINMEYLGKCD